jgi:Cd2+/Zn2+-exporting ATPase
MEPKTYKIEGLSCIDCAGRIQASVDQLEGVRKCEVDYTTGHLALWLDNPDFDVAPVAKIVENSGHKLLADPRDAHARHHREGGNSVSNFFRFLLESQETVLTVVAGVLTLLGLALALTQGPDLLWQLTFTLAVGVGGLPVLRHAYQEIWIARRLGINTLMVIAVAGALAIAEWAEAAIVVVLFALGEALEHYATARSRGALEGLLDLMPPVALRMRTDGEAEEVPVEHLAVGDRVLIRPGDRVSVDGVVLAGQSAVDQAAITGESVPVDKAPGDEVFAGTVNSFGALQVEVTRRTADNTLSRMVALVQEAQSRQAPVQRFVDRFARVYTPVVTALAFLVAVVPPLVFDQPFWGEGGWLVRALQMLVIACPCALVISTPVSVVSALTNAASQGVLIKGGRYLEVLGRVHTFAFDKTGTLTEGRPVTTDVLNVCAHASPDHSGLQYAAAVESQSSHPLARALVAEADAQKVARLPAEDVTVLSGRGVTGTVNGARVTVASHPYFDTTVPHSPDICAEAERLATEGKTVMLVGHDDQVCSVFAVADTPRLSSKRAIEALQALGDIRTVMLTGDSPSVARAIAAEVGVDEVRAELLPEEKVAAIRELASASSRANSRHKLVAMVGDGVNDAPALAQASVGIAMGGAGTAQAMETADIVLMGDDLGLLPAMVHLSRRTQRTVMANIILALAAKAAVFGLAVAGLATLWMAIAADVGTSLVVILNGMRLRR